MRPRNRFLVGLCGFAALFLLYGAKRFSLGVDFTDEGEYLTWPMVVHFGERPFAREIMTLIKPSGLFLFPLLELHPSMTLYEFRLLGWAIHLVAFATFATYLYVLSRAPIRSLLIASVPFFVCHIFGLATPSYNSLSSDSLLIALSLHGLVMVERIGCKRPLAIAAGCALFAATLAHPALGMIAGIFFFVESFKHQLWSNLLRGRLAPSNLTVVACGLCWAVVLAYLVGTHSLTDWSNRIALTQSFATSALSAQPLNFFYGLGRHAFAHSWLSAIFTLVIALSLALAGTWLAIRQKPASATLPGVLGLVLITFLIATFSYERDLLSSSFAQAALIFVGLVWIGPLLLRTPPVPSGVLFLISMSALGAVICATFTYYFSPHRSWLSGILALPFAFGVGLNHLLASNRELPRVLNGMVVLALGLTAALAANNHYAFIFRDADPQNLSAPFRVPKLRNVRSTDERVRAVNALYEYLQPRVKSGERMLAYDSCPMLYFLFDTLSAYGWAGAKRYNLTHETLARLNREMLEKPLPRYAVRALVDVSDPVWSTAPRLSYVDYPLNETVMANYVLEQTIFPFEVWRLKTLPASDR